MSIEHMKQQWTQKEVQVAIAKAVENEPAGPNRDYWTTDITVQDVKERHGLREFKPDPLTVTLVRECCGEAYTHVLRYKREAKNLKDWKCMDSRCRLKVTVLPFGKYAGLTLPLVYEKEPSYLAWFHETVEGCEEVKQVIRSLDGIEAHLTAFRARRRQVSQKRLTPTQQQVEWLMGKFSAETIDGVCEELFGGEG
jgi:hypothetical protein